MTLQINLFTSYEKRFKFTSLALNQLTKIKPENKELISLHIYCNQNLKDLWLNEVSQEKYSDLDIVLHLMENDEYILKVPMAQNTDAEFSCKWDDDVLIGSPTWDYMIENMNILSTSKTSVLAPQLTNGLPTIDTFIQDLLSPEDQKITHKIFLEEGIKTVLDIWGADYRGVQTFIESMSEWNADKYWNFMETYNPKATRPHLPNNYQWAKGVHPGRFSYTYNKFIADKILNNKEKLYGKNDFYIQPKDTAYFCNNIFITKTSFWKESFAILRDGYDEGQLTIYAKQLNMTPAYIRNSFGIHMAYGCTHRQSEIEEYYTTQLCSN